MKKALPIALVILALVALLMACGQSADEPPTTTPDPTPTPSAVQTQPVETPAPTPAPTAEPMNAVLREDMTQEELIDFFEIAHDWGEIWADFGCNEDEVLAYELEDLASWRDLRDDLIFPEDLETQYLAWREANYPNEAETPAPEPPASNPQTQPSGNNQPQPVSNQTGGSSTTTNKGTTGTQQQTGPGGATIVDDYGNPITGGTVNNGSDDIMENGGQRADFSQIKGTEHYGYTPTRPEDFDYGGN